MTTKDKCPGCGVGAGVPHKSECDVEVCSVCGGQRICCDCDGHDPVASAWTGKSNSPCGDIPNWLLLLGDESSDFRIRIYLDESEPKLIEGLDCEPTIGAYGPEINVYVHAPIEELEEMIEEAGYEPTTERVSMVMGWMQDMFNDKHGGCPAQELEGRIRSEAGEAVAFLSGSGEFDECDGDTDEESCDG